VPDVEGSFEMSKIYKSFDEYVKSLIVIEPTSRDIIFSEACWNSRQPEIEQLKARILELQNVLKFYANESNWQKQNQSSLTIIKEDHSEENHMHKVGGERARRVLMKNKETTND
jgi:hypothetical protein